MSPWGYKTGGVKKRSEGGFTMRSHHAGLRDSRLRLCRVPLAVVLAAIIGTVANDGARAEPGFPTKPIRISIPFGAGGVADLTMRLLAQGLMWWTAPAPSNEVP
jgi:hypothetical protein